jgi:hypothetical protein
MTAGSATPNRSSGVLRRLLAIVRQLLLLVAVFGATAFFLHFVHDHYPIQKWLAWHYAQAWLLGGLYVLACISGGFLTLRLVLKNSLPVAEHFTIAFAIGVFEFFVGMFLGGIFGWYGALFFVLLPALMLLSGAWPLFRFLRRFLRHRRAARARVRPPAYWSTPLLAFGLLALALVYFPILSPENVSFEARWWHLGLAEHYASAGGIHRSPEHAWAAMAPGLGAVTYGWALTMPNSMLFDRVELAAHIEFLAFVSTLAGVSAVTSRVVPRPRPRQAWVVRFLFPGVLLWSASKAAGVEQLAALFAAPVFLLLLRFWRDPSPRWGLLLGLLLAGAALTKSTAALLLVAIPLSAVLVRLAAVRSRGALAGSAVLLATFALATAPHWLKNWLWYGQPLAGPLPLAALDPRGWSESLWALLSFRFEPDERGLFAGRAIFFAPLFSAGVFLLPWLGRARRLLALYVVVLAGLALWLVAQRSDRSVLPIMPLVAAAAAGWITLVWRQNRVARVGLGGLVVLALAFGGDLLLAPNGAAAGAPQKNVLELLAAAHKKEYDERLRPFPPLYAIGGLLPRNATVLLHEEVARLGLRRATIQDHPELQNGIRYERLRSLREAFELFDQLGVTHLLWSTQKSEGLDSLAGDLVFFYVATFAAEAHSRHDGFTLARLPPEPPGFDFEPRALVLGCEQGARRTAIHPLEALARPDVVGEPEAGSAAGEIGRIDFVVIDRSCADASLVAGRDDYVLGAKRRNVELWLRSPRR